MNYRGYLLDLDGTMYRGTEKVEGASDFVQYLKAESIPYMFLTNNSSKKAEQVAEKLESLGVPAAPEQVMTSSMAAASYITSQKKKANIFVIGEEGLFHALRESGHTIVESDADFVVIGIDREISYEKLTKACLQVRNCATFISTNRDAAIPTERGMLPGNGAITSVIQVSTGIDPIYVGKPEAIIMEQALNKIGFSKEDVLMVGDNYRTDILAGINNGIDTLMVETGVNSFEEIQGLDKQPTYKRRNLIEWMEEQKDSQ
ncbi:TIGR01457 family HAD-type hydrolase [Halobacillus fulvus]|nr:TIGR01457 family HAD-type hydrolase [Halobacillus fulvus]